MIFLEDKQENRLPKKVKVNNLFYSVYYYEDPIPLVDSTEKVN